MVPPTSVHASPVTRPISLFSCTCESRNFATPSRSSSVLRRHLLDVCRVPDHPPRHLAADVADLALQVAHAGLARVAADDLAQRIVGEADLLLGQPRASRCFLTRYCLAISSFSTSV